MAPRTVTVVPYDHDWPRRFDAERAVLVAVFAATGAAIEHIGSTAVQGLGAKPIVDIMVGLRALGDAEARVRALEAVGYEYVPAYERQLPDRRYFRKPREGARAYHVHCVVKGSDFWVRHLAFRDYLRVHPDTAGAYYELKMDLAMRVTKAEYTEAKGPFIERVLAAAMAKGADDHVIVVDREE